MGSHSCENTSGKEVLSLFSTSLSWKDHGTNGTCRLSTEEEGFCPSSSKDGLKLCGAITYGMSLTESTKATQYKVQNIWQFILVITSYFSMIKFSLKKKMFSFLRTSIKIRLQICTHMTRVLDPDFLNLFCSI